MDFSKYSRPVNFDDLMARPRKVTTLRPQKRLRGKFFPPVPQWWMVKAKKNSRRRIEVVFVGLVLWQRHSLQRGIQPVKLAWRVLKEAGCGKRLVRNALQDLEKAGLIKIQTFKYRSPLITIVTEEPNGHK